MYIHSLSLYSECNERFQSDTVSIIDSIANMIIWKQKICKTNKNRSKEIMFPAYLVMALFDVYIV